MSLQNSRQISDVKVMLKVGADGAGISSIEKTGTSGLVDTYTITYTNGNKTTFTVTNGKAISSIAKTATVGLVDTYTITYNDGTIDTFDVTNGADGEDGAGISNIAKTSTSGAVDTYTITLTNGDTYTFTVTNGGGSTLGSLSDVDLTSPTDGQVLKYNGTSGEWENGEGRSSLSLLTDVDLTSPTDGQILKYNASSQKWENGDSPASSPNPNLLLNPWFTLNQRGQSSYNTETSYGVDRWQNNFRDVGTVSPTSNGLQINFESGYVFIRQYWEDNSLVGKTITFSMRVGNTIYSDSGIFGTENLIFRFNDNKIAVALNYDSTNNRNQILIYAYESTIIRAVKLEIGSTSTLAMDVAPDITTEMLKCQRYYHVYKTSSYRPTNKDDCVPNMRVNPTQTTITISSTTYYVNDAEIY